MKRIEDTLADPEVRRTFEEELLFGEATDTVAGMMVSSGVSQKELARRLGVTKGRVSQILSGGENLTLRSLAALGWALGLRFEFKAIAVPNRQGTPAETDPHAPEWLLNLAAQSNLRFLKLALPKKPESGDLRPLAAPPAADVEAAA